MTPFGHKASAGISTQFYVTYKELKSKVVHLICSFLKQKKIRCKEKIVTFDTFGSDTTSQFLQTLQISQADVRNNRNDA